jgi:glycerophosphoryl diester phosphodiesterase
MDLAVIGHRGASGYVPEHSLAAYMLAVGLGADYIEPDLVISKDGIFYALHDLLLDLTTNVADFPEFADRLTTRDVDGVSYTGFFVSDFDSSELKLLRLKQRLSITRTTVFDNTLTMPTLTEIFQMTNNLTSSSGRKVGLYIELKHPNYYRSINFSMEDMILKSLTDANYVIKNVKADLFRRVAPIVIQCFEPETLIYLRSQCDLPLVQLVGVTETQHIADVWNGANLDRITKYANGIGPPTSFFTDSQVSYSKATYMIDQARTRKMVVHPYVLKSDSEMKGNSSSETLFFVCCLEIDGIFTDYADRTRVAVAQTSANPLICANICPEKFQLVGVEPYDLTYPVAVLCVIVSIAYYFNFIRPPKSPALSRKEVI